MKKCFSLILAAVISLMITMTAAADGIYENVSVYYNGEKQPQTVTVTEIDGSVLIPIRPVWDLFSTKLTWYGMRKRITSSTALGKTIIQIGSAVVSVNGNNVYVAATYPRIFGGSTLIPLDLAEACTGASIKYVTSNQSLQIVRD